MTLFSQTWPNGSIDALSALWNIESRVYHATFGSGSVPCRLQPAGRSLTEIQDHIQRQSHNR